MISNNSKKNNCVAIRCKNAHAVPALLDQNKNLVSFYTDIHSSHFLFRLIKLLLPEKFQFKTLKNLLSRKLPNELNRRLVKDQIISSLFFFNSSRKRSDIIFRRVIKEKFSGATALYTNFINDDIELIRKAKKLGIEIIHEYHKEPKIFFFYQPQMK